MPLAQIASATLIINIALLAIFLYSANITARLSPQAIPAKAKIEYLITFNIATLVTLHASHVTDFIALPAITITPYLIRLIARDLREARKQLSKQFKPNRPGNRPDNRHKNRDI